MKRDKRAYNSEQFMYAKSKKTHYLKLPKHPKDQAPIEHKSASEL